MVPQYGAKDNTVTIAADHHKKKVKGKSFFGLLGSSVIAMLCVVPIWNAIALLADRNFVFWEGYTEPLAIIGTCVGVIVFYTILTLSFTKVVDPTVQAEGTILTIANIFITVMGLALILCSMRLSSTSVNLYDSLMHECETDPRTHRLYEYSQVLHNIRRMPGCLGQYSVEDCVGYENAKPYTEILKNMENEYRCSGFCYKPPPGLAVVETSEHVSHAGKHYKSQSLLATDSDAQSQAYNFPPTLFSDANYKTSCEGMVARDFKNFVGDVGFQLFWQGAYLTIIAVVSGFMRLIGLCMAGDKDNQGHPTLMALGGATA